MEPFRAGDFVFLLELYIVYILICINDRGRVEIFFVSANFFVS